MTKARDVADLLANGTVDTNELADGLITTAKLADNSVTTAKISDAAITADKLDVQGSDIPYDNTTSGISANTLQEAIDYLNVLSGGGSAGAQATYTRDNFTATAGQTAFTTSNGYTLGYVQVFMNGVLLAPSDFTANDESTVVLAVGASAGDEISVVAYDSFAISEVLRVLSISASAPDNSVVLNADGGIQLGGTGGGTGGAVLHLEKGNLGTSAGDYDILHRVYQHNGNASYLDTMQVRTYANNVWNGAGFRIQQKIDSTWMGFVEFNGATNGGVSIGAGLSTGNPNDIPRRLTVDPDGRVTMPYQPAFHARGNTSGWWAFSANGTHFPVNSVSAQTTSGDLAGFNVTTSGLGAYNTGSHFSKSTGIFTAPVGGRYMFYSQVLLRRQGTTYTEYATLSFFLNGVFTQGGWDQALYQVTSNSGAEYILKTSQSVYMSAGDTMRCGLSPTSSNIQWYADRYAFGGYLIG